MKTARVKIIDELEPNDKYHYIFLIVQGLNNFNIQKSSPLGLLFAI